MGQKLTELEEVVSPAGTDLLYIVSGGVDKKVQVGNLLVDVPPFGLKGVTGWELVASTFLSNAPSGISYVYTCPVGKKALWVQTHYINPTGGAITLNSYGYEAVGGVRRPVNWAVAASIASLAHGSGTMAFLLTAGEKVFFDAAASGMNVAVKVLEIDDGAPLYRFDSELITGDNVLFTVPSGKAAVPLGQSLGGVYVPIASAITIVNLSGGTRTYSAHIFPVGVSASTNDTKWSATFTIANAAQSQTFVSPLRLLEAGEKFVINSDSSAAAQYAYGTYYLFDR